MAAKLKRAALYLRVSTSDQTVTNQRLELKAAAEARGWNVVAVFADEGISGAKGRDLRPQLDAMIKAAVQRRFDIVMTWAVDRLGRSLPDLIGTMQDLQGAKVDLFIHQQGLDTTTPSGRAMFGMLGVFAEFERAMIQSRVNAGLARARENGTRSGKPIGRPRASDKLESSIRQRLKNGQGMISIAKEMSCGVSVVQRVKIAAAGATAG